MDIIPNPEIEPFVDPDFAADYLQLVIENINNGLLEATHAESVAASLRCNYRAQ